MLGLTLPSSGHGLTLAELASAKGLSEDFLRSFGVTDGFTGSGKSRQPCVDIPYVDAASEAVAMHKRLSLDGHPRFIWRRGDRPTLYGLAHLRDIRRAGWVVLTEGETDCWTLWMHRIPALGLPGASTWKEHLRHFLDGLTVYIWHEPDGGGDGLVKAISGDLPDLRIIEAPPGVKDPSELYLQPHEDFKERMMGLVGKARPASELRAQELSAEAREAFDAACPLLESPDILSRLAEELQAMGFAGDPRPAIMGYVAITSRLLTAPLNLAYISQSASGKNAAAEASLPFFPEHAYYLVRASSPRALVYNEEMFTHRTVVLTEADSLPEDGPAASAVRSLMSDGEMVYEVVEKGEDGGHRVRKITKPGPTGIITTSTKPLGEQASTRTLTVSISDSPEQTRLIMHAHVKRANSALTAQDLSQWVMLQRWLELAGERRVFIPYAHALADALPARAVRMRRDFPQLLTVIQAIAALHQRQRDRDAGGRIIATLEDYARARWLLEEVFTTTVNEGITPAIQQTVEAVARLSSDGTPVSEQALVKDLGLAKSTVSYRVKRALKGGFLVNQAAQKGAPAQLVLGTPLPENNSLPEPTSLVVGAVESQNQSNPRTALPGPSGVQAEISGSNDSDGVRTVFEPGSNALPGQSWGRFEGFDTSGGDTQHTRVDEAEGLNRFPWDEFLEESGNGQDTS
jgi:hypothetical protein